MSIEDMNDFLGATVFVVIGTFSVHLERGPFTLDLSQ